MNKEEEEKIENIKQAKIENTVEVVSMIGDKVADNLGYSAALDPIVGGLANQVATQAIDILKNPEPTIAFAKGWAKEKLDNVKDFIADKLGEKDVAKEWGEEIKNKEERCSQALEQTKAMQESQLKDSKKIGYEEKLDLLDKNIEKEKNNLKNSIGKENSALQQAIESTKDLDWQDRNKEIEKQRKEFDERNKEERYR